MAELETTDTLDTATVAATITATITATATVTDTVIVGTSSAAGDTTRVTTAAAVAQSPTVTASASTAKFTGVGELRAAHAAASDVATTPSEREGVGELPSGHVIGAVAFLAKRKRLGELRIIPQRSGRTRHRWRL